MLIRPLTTGESKVATGSMILLLLALPIINTLVESESLGLLLTYLVAVLIGSALGWVAGDAFTQSNDKGKLVTALGAIVVAILVNVAPIRKALGEAGQSQQGAFLYELFVRPFQSGSFIGSAQYGTLAFVVFMLLAIFYINSPSKTAAATPKTPPPAPTRTIP